MLTKIFITSGGTGGHIIPARCLATHLSQKKFEIFFFGDEKYRSYIQESDQFQSKIISSSQFKKNPTDLLKAAVKITIGIIQSLYFFLKLRPKYVVAFGGYSTFPVLIAAIITKTKIILHEQNSHLGKVNRIFAKYAKKIALSFAETSGICATISHKTTFTGNPVRAEILELNKISYSLPQAKKIAEIPHNKMGYDVILASDFYPENSSEDDADYAEGLFNILVIGGSGGAKIFSEILPMAFFNLNRDLKNSIKLVQQCREELLQETFEKYKSFDINITMNSFFKNMPSLIERSQLVIARSGSSSIFEFCAAKKPMILVPFALSADDHQEKNARYLEKHGAAIVVTEKEFTINKMNELLKNLINNPATLKKMSDNAASLAVLDATENLAQLLND